MNADKALSLFGGILTIGLVTVIVTKPNTSKVITAVGTSFSSVMRTAMGYGLS